MHLFVSELYKYQNARCNDKNYIIMCFVAQSLNNFHHNRWNFKCNWRNTAVTNFISVASKKYHCTPCETYPSTSRNSNLKSAWSMLRTHISHLRQRCHNSKFVIFQEKCLKVLKCYNFCERNDDTTALQRRVLQTVMTLYLLKVHLNKISSYTNNSKMPI